MAPALVRHQFQSPSDPSVEEKTRPKVLVVEDNESNMKFITDLLEDAGYEAIHAFSAETAIKQTEIEKPSLKSYGHLTSGHGRTDRHQSPKA